MNSGIYIITFNNEPIYVGSTIGFYNRVANHKSCVFNSNLNNKQRDLPLYNYIREVGFNNIKIELLFPQEGTKEELKIIELEHYDRLKGLGCILLNVLAPHIIDKKAAKNIARKKCYDKHKEKEIEYAKQYRLDNLEQVKQNKQIRNSIKTICECGGIYSPDHKSRHLKTLKHLKSIK